MVLQRTVSFKFLPMGVHPRTCVCTIFKEEANSRENINWSELIKQTIQAKTQPAQQAFGSNERLVRRLRWGGIFESSVILNKREITNITHIWKKLKIVNLFKVQVKEKSKGRSCRNFMYTCSFRIEKLPDSTIYLVYRLCTFDFSRTRGVLN